MKSHTIHDRKISLTISSHTDHLRGSLANLLGPALPTTEVPLLAIEVYDRLQLRVERVNRYTIEKVEVSDNSAHITVADPKHHLTVGLWLTIKDGQLSVLVPPAEVCEHKPMLARVFNIEVLPGVMCANATGEMLLPINTGVICRPGNKTALSDRFLIYGEQSRWELLPTLPACAVQNITGGWAAVAASGAAETECHATTYGDGTGSVSLSFHFRGNDPDPVDPCNREIRIAPIPPGDNITVFTAHMLRGHITKELGKPELRKRAEESLEVKHLLGAYVMKLFYGVQMQGMMVNEPGHEERPRFFLAMTFDEAATGLERLHAAGVDRVYAQNVGWNFRGHDGAYPTRFPVEERVGGEAAFRKMIATAHALGYAMTVHDNFMEAYESSPDFDPALLIKDIYGNLQLRGFWGGGPSYLQWPATLTDDAMERHLLRVKDLGIVGPYYLDGMGSPLYVNYDPAHRGTRTAHAAGMDRFLRAARKVYGSCATETGFLYCSLTPDLIANPGGEHLVHQCKPHWPITKMLDEIVPLWQITMSGLVVVENQGIEWTDTMTALLFGHHPRYEWSTRPGIMPVLEDELIAKIKARYDLLIKRFGDLCLSQIIDYSKTGNVVRTAFETGTVVTADYATGRLFVNDEEIVRPEALGGGPQPAVIVTTTKPRRKPAAV